MLRVIALRRLATQCTPRQGTLTTLLCTTVYVVVVSVPFVSLPLLAAVCSFACQGPLPADLRSSAPDGTF